MKRISTDSWLAAVLPGTGRDAAFRLHKESGSDGFVIETGNGGELVATLSSSTSG